MRVMSWNVDGTFPPAGSPKKIEQRVQWLASLEHLPEILLLQEVNPHRQELWYDLLRNNLGYKAMTDTLDQALALDNSNGHITAIAGDWNLSDNKAQLGKADAPIALEDRELAFPEKFLVTDLAHPAGNIEVLNIRAVPGGEHGVEKLKLLEAAFDWVEAADERPRILAGDLNTPRQSWPTDRPSPSVTIGSQICAAGAWPPSRTC
ncbi:endonuclease/exonuclease/phosphatase family protein [Haloprofundus salinisoli]|uniref:endonuclease/exonuclease/phosphatase family protein n=1 Tax=Haloprofundus salinisoli TaxID=2876193 RepID=UPI001CCDEB8F|nr:endonuclease/exonuclease/phosphatase family protein [Haloprofundus salinisoli]